MMRIMLFVDLENFKEGLWKISNNKLDFRKFHLSLFEYVVNKISWMKFCPELIRAYIYTGEYTDVLINYIKKELKLSKPEDQFRINNYLNTLIRRKKSQERNFRFANYCDLIEIKKAPLHYAPREAVKGKGVFQKGIDVELAVDLVSHAYKDNFDVAVICSGDVDLLSSLKIVKSLGKKIVLISHPKLVSETMIKESDYFFKLTDFGAEELNSLFNINKK